MERRASRVSGAQWGILLEYLERFPSLARARGYNNSARGRAESSRLWQDIANSLNAEGTGTTKSAKNWSIYVSNYKSKLKKLVANINADINATGGGPPNSGALSEIDQRVLAIMGPGFGMTAPQVSVHPFPDADQQQPSTTRTTSAVAHTFNMGTEDVEYEIAPENMVLTYSDSGSPIFEEHIFGAPASPTPNSQLPLQPPSIPRQTRRTRHRSRPLAPLDEARKILSTVEMQRAAADAATARALNLIAQNLGRLVDIADRYVSSSSPQ